jgi:hypothetical protein
MSINVELGLWSRLAVEWSGPGDVKVERWLWEIRRVRAREGSPVTTYILAFIFPSSCVLLWNFGARPAR